MKLTILTGPNRGVDIIFNLVVCLFVTELFQHPWMDGNKLVMHVYYTYASVSHERDLHPPLPVPNNNNNCNNPLLWMPPSKASIHEYRVCFLSCRPHWTGQKNATPVKVYIIWDNYCTPFHCFDGDKSQVVVHRLAQHCTGCSLSELSVFVNLMNSTLLPEGWPCFYPSSIPTHF